MTTDNQHSIPVFRPLLGEEEIAACRAVLEEGWLGMGSYVGKFERALEELLASPNRHVVAVSTGHAALHLALLMMGVGPGDEVISPSFNNIADLQAVIATGATLVLCDIDDRRLCIDPVKLAEVVSSRTRVVIVTDYGCHLAQHDDLRTLAGNAGFSILHDAAHSFGSTYSGQRVGSFSDVTMFSFDPVKTVTCIDGGALVVQTEQEVEILHAMRLIGMGQPSSVMYEDQRAWTYDVKTLGFRYHLANLHAAVGLAQLQKLETMSSNRRTYCRFLNRNLKELEFLRVPATDFEGVTPFLYYVRVPAHLRESFRHHLAARGIDTGVHWQPGHWFSLFSTARRGELAVTDKVGKEIVTLPLHSVMSETELERIAEAVKTYPMSSDLAANR